MELEQLKGHSSASIFFVFLVVSTMKVKILGTLNTVRLYLTPFSPCPQVMVYFVHTVRAPKKIEFKQLSHFACLGPLLARLS